MLLERNRKLRQQPEFMQGATPLETWIVRVDPAHVAEEEADPQQRSNGDTHVTRRLDYERGVQSERPNPDLGTEARAQALRPSVVESVGVEAVP